MNRTLAATLGGLMVSGLLANGAAAQAPPQVQAKGIVLIRPGSSGVLPDQETIQNLLMSWQWPEAINPQPVVGDFGDTRPYYVDFKKLESHHNDAILGIVSVVAHTEQQAARRALQDVIGYLESALAEIGTAIEESRKVDAEVLSAQVRELEVEIEALEARDVELRSANVGAEPGNWENQLGVLRHQLAQLNAQVGEQRMRLAQTHDQIAAAKKAAADSAQSGEKTLDALQQLANMQMQEVQHAEDLAKQGLLSQGELNKAREQFLKAEIQLREKKQLLTDQIGAHVRQLSDQEQTISHEMQALEARRQDLEAQLSRLQAPETKAALVEQQKVRRQLERARQRLHDAEQRYEQLSRRQPDTRAPRVIRIEPKQIVP